MSDDLRCPIVHSSEIAGDPGGWAGNYVLLEDAQASLRAVEQERDEACAEKGLWHEAACKKIRTWETIQGRAKAGESPESLATDYGVPLAWIRMVLYPENDLDARYGRPSDRTKTAKARALAAEQERDAYLALAMSRARDISDLEHQQEVIEQERDRLRAALEKLRAFFEVRRDDYSKQACDECDESPCSKFVMCGYHSLLSEVNEVLAALSSPSPTPQEPTS